MVTMACHRKVIQRGGTIYGHDIGGSRGLSNSEDSQSLGPTSTCREGGTTPRCRRLQAAATTRSSRGCSRTALELAQACCGLPPALIKVTKAYYAESLNTTHVYAAITSYTRELGWVIYGCGSQKSSAPPQSHLRPEFPGVRLKNHPGPRDQALAATSKKLYDLRTVMLFQYSAG